jgi:hypothetical protein
MPTPERPSAETAALGLSDPCTRAMAQARPCTGSSVSVPDRQLCERVRSACEEEEGAHFLRRALASTQPHFFAVDKRGCPCHSASLFCLLHWFAPARMLAWHVVANVLVATIALDNPKSGIPARLRHAMCAVYVRCARACFGCGLKHTLRLLREGGRLQRRDCDAMPPRLATSRSSTARVHALMVWSAAGGDIVNVNVQSVEECQSRCAAVSAPLHGLCRRLACIRADCRAMIAASSRRSFPRPSGYHVF